MKKIINFIDKNFKILFIILIVIAVSLFSVSFGLAIYAEKFTKKTDELKIAKYSINQSATIDLGMISPGETLTYKFEVSNIEEGEIAEVAQKYNVKILSTKNLPLTYTLVGDSTYNNGTLAGDINQTTLTTETSGVFPHTKEAKHTYELKISWPSDKTGKEFLNEVDQVSLSIESVQIEPVQKK